MPRRTFTREFKESAVKLVTQQGYSARKAAEALGVDRVTIASWVAGTPPAPTPGDAAAELRRENDRLRAENQRLTMERDILKKATAFFAREHS
jgi:transposase